MHHHSERARCFVGIGEVLFDVFENGTETLGGAPLNVAVQAHQLAAPLGIGSGVVVSCVGADSLGERIRSELRHRGMSTQYIVTDPNRPTGRVSVFLRDGEPAYQIEPDTAWDHVVPDPSFDQLARTCDAVCFGSLAQRSPVSRMGIRRFLENATQAVRMFDVNLRSDTVSAEIVASSCQLATIVKANCSELSTICELLGIGALEDDGDSAILRRMERLLARFPVQAVVVTRGARGAILLTRELEISLGAPHVPAHELHAVGAGDACSAGILVGMTLGWDLVRVVDLANRMGAWVASQPSATPPLPDSILELAREISCPSPTLIGKA